MSRLQSILDPMGPQARPVTDLWWLMFWIAAAVCAGVGVVLLVALRRARARADAPSAPLEDRPLERIILGSAVVTALILVGLVALSVRTGRAVEIDPAKPMLRIRITGHQWWWGVDYLDPSPSRQVTSANEIHVPVGQDVELELRSPDVIHSLWLPNVAGKRDLVPGRNTMLRIRVDSAGAWRGQCAEFCGHQHAKMALWIVAHPPGDFAAWYNQQLAVPPAASDSTHRGRTVFLGTTCVMCHAMRGTSAGSRVGPELTHVAGRRSLAAGTLPNTAEALTRWLRDPQGIKPGARMPPSPLSDTDLAALVDFLMQLR